MRRCLDDVSVLLLMSTESDVDVVTYNIAMLFVPTRKFQLSRFLRNICFVALLTSLLVIWNGQVTNHATKRTGRSLKWSSEIVYNSHGRRLTTACDVMKDDGCIEYKLENLFKGVNGNWSTVYENQLRRQRHLVTACKSLSLGLETPNFTFSSLYINDAQKYIYCGVNKVATTNWKRVLLKASEAVTVDRPEKLQSSSAHDTDITDRYFPRIRHFNYEEVQRRLKSHFKFVFVRDPMERLVSAYRDKFVKQNEGGYYQRRFGVRAIKMARGKNATKESLLRGHDLKFTEMVSYLLNPKVDPAFRMLSDAHWSPQNGQCYPCYVQYDFIGHHETLFEDAQFVLARIGVSDIVQFPNFDPDNQWRRPTYKIAQEMLGLLSAEQLERLRLEFHVDSILYGYKEFYPQT